MGFEATSKAKWGWILISSILDEVMSPLALTPT